MRPEKDILLDLEKVCQSPGYIHVLAFLTFRDNYVPYGSNGIKDESAVSQEELIRSEFRLLQGLMIKHIRRNPAADHATARPSSEPRKRY